MSTGVEVIGLDECKRDLRRLGADIVDGRGVLKQFFRVWAKRVDIYWKRIKVTGGMFRGRKWAPMQPQYTRADGTPVPAWGGVKRVRKGRGLKRKGGNVKAKKRPSGKPVKTSSVLMRDTGALYRDITNKWLALTKSYLDVGTSLEYGEEQHRRRNVVFWQPRVDESKLWRIYGHAIDLAIKKRGFA